MQGRSRRCARLRIESCGIVDAVEQWNWKEDYKEGMDVRGY